MLLDPRFCVCGKRVRARTGSAQVIEFNRRSTDPRSENYQLTGKDILDTPDEIFRFVISVNPNSAQSPCEVEGNCVDLSSCPSDYKRGQSGAR